MSRWTWPATLWVIGLAGLVTLSPFFYQLPGLGWENLLSRELYQRLAWVALPTVLFLAASFLCRQLPWMQLFVAVAAVALAVFLAGICWYELSHHITGNRSSYGVTPAYLALLFAPVPALMVLLLAVLAAVWRWFRSK
jgi:hypothetical protein